jgi:hypothetical protein
MKRNMRKGDLIMRVKERVRATPTYSIVFAQTVLSLNERAFSGKTLQMDHFLWKNWAKRSFCLSHSAGTPIALSSFVDELAPI